ncbi:MAG TPA: MarR family transcriptional regulator [Candidatus Dormibacteraeota bacterium]|nr:MarR family transcriptional regulator [Candidatus Dormibacteraeota bacterium]
MTDSNTSSEVTSPPEAEMAPDEAGCLYDTRARPMFDHLAGLPDGRRLEVFPALRWCAYRIQRFMQAEADQYGLTDGAARVLMQLRHAGEQPLGALAAGLHVSPKNITLLMDQLEKDGLVVRVPDPADRRSVRARLTEEGQRTVGRFLHEFMTHSLKLVEDLPQEDLERVRHVALLLVQRIEARLSVAPRRSR